MEDVSESLTRLNARQRLHVLRGSPEEVLPVVWKEWGITHMVFEKVCARLTAAEEHLNPGLTRMIFRTQQRMVRLIPSS